MYELGGQCARLFRRGEQSSAAKGESVADTVRVVGCYADIIAMRHPKEGAPLVAAMKSTCRSSTLATAATTTPPRR